MLGPRLGPRLLYREGGARRRPGGARRRRRAHRAGEELAADEVLHGEGAAVEGFAIAQNGALSIALDTTLDEELIREGRVRDLNHRINALRRDMGPSLTDRIVVTLGPEEADLLQHKSWIKEETLALEVHAGDALAIEKP